MAEYAISFDGVNDHLSFPEIATTSSSGSEDWEFEFKWTMQDTGWQRAFARLISGGDDRALFNATEFRWYRGASAVIWAGLSLSVSVDYVFKIVASQSSGVYELFVDGVSRGTKTASIGLPFPLFAYSGVNYDTYSTGHLHYFKFTDNADPTNSRHYALNEGSGLLALDNLEPDAKKGSLVNAPVWLDMGGGAWAVDFDYASQQYGKTNYAPPDSDFEIEIDVTFGSVSTSENHKTLFSYDDDGSSNAILTLYHHKWDGVKAQISTGGLGQIVTVTGPKYAAGARKKFKVVYQKLSQIELWIDDVLHASMPITYDYGAFKSLRLAHKSTSGDYFDGLIHSFKCTDLAGPRDRLFAMNEGAGAEINDSLFPLNAERSASLVNFPGDDSQWILISGGGGAESHSGFLVSVGTANLISTGLKNGFGVSLSSNVSASSVLALARKFGVSASTNAADTSSSGFAHMLGYIISSAISQTSATGVKNEFVSKLGALASVNASNSAIAGFKSAFGTLSESHALQALVAGFKAAFSGISSTTGTVTTVSGTADDLIRLSGFAISSNATAAVVEGLKIALGAILISSAANSTNSGAKSAQGAATSDTSATTQLLALAHKAGVLISANEVNTLIIGYNPDSDNPVARTRTTGVLPYYHLNGVLNTLQIAATL